MRDKSSLLCGIIVRCCAGQEFTAVRDNSSLLCGTGVHCCAGQELTTVRDKSSLPWIGYGALSENPD